MVIGTGADLASVNQLVPATDAFTQTVLDRLFLSLFEEQPDFAEQPPTFDAQIASEWSWSSDHLTLDVELRDDLVWSDGVALTSEDVVWTWQMQTSEKINWNQANSKENIVAIEALDPTRLRVRFAEKNDSQIWDLNEGVILPKHAWSRLPLEQWPVDLGWFVDHLVTSGPYRLDRWDREQQIVLSRNPLYFDPDLPLIDRLVFRVVPQPVNQIGQLFSGQLDFINNVPIREAGGSTAPEGVGFKAYWAGRYGFVCWNLENPLFAETEVRQALTMAIDRQALVDTLWFGRAKIATSPIPSSVWAHNRDLEPFPYDPKEATRRLAEHGWSDTNADGILDRQGENFAFELMTNSNSGIRVDAAVMIQEQLRRVGIEVKVVKVDFAALGAAVYSHDFEAALLGLSIDTSLDQTAIFHSSSADGKRMNFGSYSNPDVDRLIELSNTDLDTAQKKATLDELQSIIHLDQPYTFLWESQRLAGLSTRVQNADPNATDPLFRIETWWLQADR